MGNSIAFDNALATRVDATNLRDVKRRLQELYDHGMQLMNSLEPNVAANWTQSTVWNAANAVLQQRPELWESIIQGEIQASVQLTRLIENELLLPVYGPAGVDVAAINAAGADVAAANMAGADIAAANADVAAANAPGSDVAADNADVTVANAVGADVATDNADVTVINAAGTDVTAVKTDVVAANAVSADVATANADVAAANADVAAVNVVDADGAYVATGGEEVAAEPQTKNEQAADNETTRERQIREWMRCEEAREIQRMLAAQPQEQDQDLFQSMANALGIAHIRPSDVYKYNKQN